VLKALGPLSTTFVVTRVIVFYGSISVAYFDAQLAGRDSANNALYYNNNINKFQSHQIEKFFQVQKI
jgi:hypothetical protein